jgi:hypothetical protein
MMYLILLHELTHAMGLWTHNLGFRRRFIHLLAKYCREDAGRLTLSAGLHGLKT